MKKLALALAFVASSAFAAVVGTPHDLTNLANNTATGACQYCHMPHHANAAATATGAPLWAKTIYSDYTAITATASGTTVNAPAGPSQACLSCHDGTASAVSTQHNGTTLADATTVPGLYSVGKDIRNDHPVSLTYTAAGGGLSGLATITAARTAGFVFFGAGLDQLECGSCHDPHNNPAVVGNFLRAASAADFCAACHATK